MTTRRQAHKGLTLGAGATLLSPTIATSAQQDESTRVALGTLQRLWPLSS